MLTTNVDSYALRTCRCRAKLDTIRVKWLENVPIWIKLNFETNTAEWEWKWGEDEGRTENGFVWKGVEGDGRQWRRDGMHRIPQWCYVEWNASDTKLLTWKFVQFSFDLIALGESSFIINVCAGFNMKIYTDFPFYNSTRLWDEERMQREAKQGIVLSMAKNKYINCRRNVLDIRTVTKLPPPGMFVHSDTR